MWEGQAGIRAVREKSSVLDVMGLGCLLHSQEELQDKQLDIKSGHQGRDYALCEETEILKCYIANKYP